MKSRARHIVLVVKPLLQASHHQGRLVQNTTAQKASPTRPASSAKTRRARGGR